jgi:hypothetical protein
MFIENEGRGGRRSFSRPTALGRESGDGDKECERRPFARSMPPLALLAAARALLFPLRVKSQSSNASGESKDGKSNATPGRIRSASAGRGGSPLSLENEEVVSTGDGVGVDLFFLPSLSDDFVRNDDLDWELRSSAPAAFCANSDRDVIGEVFETLA